jgi:hypothetical protein
VNSLLSLYLLIIPTLFSQLEKQDQEKAIGNMQESQNIHQVLCIDIKLSANAAELFDEFQTASSAGGTTAQRAKVVAMLFSGAVEVEEEVPIKGEVEPIAGSVDDGGGGTDVGLVDVVGEVLEVPDDLVELANV